MISTDKDPIVLELEVIAKTRLSIPCTFFHANLFEENVGLDTVKSADFPVLIHVATTNNDYEVSGALSLLRKAKVECLLLNRIEKNTTDFSSMKVNNEINKMRQLGENLIYWVNKSALSVNGGVDKFTLEPLYEQMDDHLFGVAVSFEWAHDQGLSGYNNPPS